MASTYLTRTLSSAGTLTKFTISVWVKRSSLSGYNTLFQSEANGGYFRIQFDNNQKINLLDDNTGLNKTTSQVFRDVNAWYHFVFAFDSSQATASNRDRMYVNGEEITSWSTNTSSTQNNSYRWQENNQVQNVGRHGGGSEYFDGVMSHIHLIDNTQYSASDFGSTDSTTGEWKINTSPSVTYGTNGAFILKDGNSVTDQSSNSNNFTVGGGTLTKTEDCPSNVFATLNLLDAFNTSGRTLSNGNNTYTTSSGNNSEVAGTLAASSGKYYFETKIVSQSGSTGSSAKYGVIGVKKINKGTLAAGEAATIYSDGRKNNGYDSVNNATPGYTLNDIVQVALDLDNNQIFFGLNGNWGDNAGNFNQTFANATALYTSLSTVGEWTPYLNKNVTNDNTLTLSANFGNGYFGTTAVASEGANASGNGIFEYDVPTGYTALSTKGLNL